MSAPVGKAQLAQRLGWSRPTLDRRLKEDPAFPVISRGTQAGGWSFDPAAVEAHLSGAAPPDADAAVPTDDATPPVGAAAEGPRFPVARATHQGEATARQRKDLAEAQRLEDRLKRERGELVPAADMKDVLSLVLVELRTSLLGIPDAVVKEFNLSERVGHSMRGRIETMMRATVMKVRQQLTADIEAD